MIKHTFKTESHTDPRLKPCPLCGHDMLGRWKNSYAGAGWIFSCSNEECILHRLRNNIRVPAFYNPTKATTEQEAIEIINKRC